MPKNRNMGRKSHHVQDMEYKQNVSQLEDDIPTDQPTRPTLGKTQATKSSKEEPRNTK
jgi:hypothetical protein